MARLTEPDLLAKYLRALKDWKVEGAIAFDGRAVEGLRTTLEGVTVRSFKEILHQYVCVDNGEIDQVQEEREPWRGVWEWHFDLRPTVAGIKVYIETQLSPESFGSKDEPTIHVVQIKPA